MPLSPDHPKPLTPSDYIQIKLQDGPLNEVGPNGCQIDDVLLWTINKLKVFNEPPYNTRQTSLAITHLQEALHWLADRTADRVARGVEGTSQP